MMLHRLGNRLRRNRGMTLVEIVAGIAILGLLALLLSTVFATGIGIVGRQAQQKQANANAAGGVENAAAGDASASAPLPDESSGSFSIRFGDNTVEIPGSYYESPENGYDRNFRYFVPET